MGYCSRLQSPWMNHWPCGERALKKHGYMAVDGYTTSTLTCWKSEGRIKQCEVGSAYIPMLLSCRSMQVDFAVSSEYRKHLTRSTVPKNARNQSTNQQHSYSPIFARYRCSLATVRLQPREQHPNLGFGHQISSDMHGVSNCHSVQIFPISYHASATTFPRSRTGTKRTTFTGYISTCLGI